MTRTAKQAAYDKARADRKAERIRNEAAEQYGQALETEREQTARRLRDLQRNASAEWNTSRFIGNR